MTCAKIGQRSALHYRSVSENCKQFFGPRNLQESQAQDKHIGEGRE